MVEEEAGPKYGSLQNSDYYRVIMQNIHCRLDNCITHYLSKCKISDSYKSISIDLSKSFLVLFIQLLRQSTCNANVNLPNL